MKHFVTVSLLLFSCAVMAQPVITLQPESQTTCPNDCADFSVAAVGSGLQYRWYEVSANDTTQLAGAIEADYSYCDTPIENNGIGVMCKVTDMNGAFVWSDLATIAIDSCLPAIAGFTWEWNHLEICFANTSTNAHTVFWLFGDNATDASNADEICHTYDSKQIYYVKLQAFNDHSSDEIEHVINLLGEEELETSVDLFPNPAVDHLQIQSQSRIEQVVVRDITGRECLRQMPNTSVWTLDVKDLPSGFYHVMVQAEGRHFETKVLVQ
jgi:PKD repeat protein